MSQTEQDDIPAVNNPPTVPIAENDAKTTLLLNSRSRAKALAGEYAIDFLITREAGHDLLERARLREHNEVKRQQENLEQITKLAYDSCGEEKAGIPDPDWIHYFLSIAKNIRSTAMQKLWSRVLKQEITTPGTTSIHTLDTLRKMTQREAQMFHRACMLACHFGGDEHKKLLTGVTPRQTALALFRPRPTDKLPLGSFQLPYSSLLILMDLGLILRGELESGEIATDSPLAFGYQGYQYRLRTPKKGITFTYYRFSPTGQEIACLLGKKHHEPFKESLLEVLAKHFVIEEVQLPT
ncbi:TIGR03899 family protein [Photobacterium sp. MCCC 1A19761]|uniref:TIGR03899 family protein n=1 Tax=Photobacterium sp. MCCC 1A19761 TaxID=3115000 RepID=UPI00307DBCD2